MVCKIPSIFEKIKEVTEQAREELKNFLKGGEPILSKANIDVRKSSEYKRLEVTIRKHLKKS